MRDFEAMLPVLRQLGRGMAKYASIERRPFDFGVGMPLYPGEIHMVSTVDMLDSPGVTQLAKEFGVTKGAVSQMIGKLVDKGLLRKETDLENRSRVVVSLTDLGKRANENHMAFHKEHDRAFFDYLAGLDDASFKLVEELGERINLWMDGYLD